MARGSYETYEEYYKQYTKGGRLASPKLTPRQFEKAYESYRGTGPNVARRMVADQMELSQKQIKGMEGYFRRELTAQESQERSKEKVLRGKSEKLTSYDEKIIKKKVAERMKEMPDVKRMSREEWGERVKEWRAEGKTEEEIREALGSPNEVQVLSKGKQKMRVVNKYNWKLTQRPGGRKQGV